MSKSFELIGFVSNWKDKHKSPFDAYMEIVKFYINQIGKESPELVDSAMKQYSAGNSVQDITLSGKNIRVLIFGDGLYNPEN